MAKGKKPQAHEISIGKIIDDRELQPRASIDLDVVREYAEAMMEEESEFPPVVVFFDGVNYWLADGFHRVKAAIKADRKSINALVYQGDKQDALLHSVGANWTNGVRRTQADKRAAVLKMLNHPEWCLWSDQVIARYVHVSASTVGRYRANSPGVLGHDVKARVGEDGLIHRPVNGRSEPPAVQTDQIPSKYELPPTPLSKVDLVETFKRKITRHVKSICPTAQTNVLFDFGEIEIVTDQNIYTFATAYERDRVYAAIGRAMVMLRCIGHPGRAVVIGHFPKPIRDVISRAREIGVDFTSPEEVLEWKGAETA